MSPLKQAIKKTINYAKFFDYDLTLNELHHWLISDKTYPLSSIAKNSSLTNKFSNSRKKKALLTQKKLQTLEKVLPLLRMLPTIRLIAITGSLSMNNANPKDDIDIMIITSSNTLWITRPFAILILSLFSKRRHPNQKAHTKNSICPNLWLDTKALKVPKSKQNLYIENEVLQIKPIFDREETYQSFLLANI